MSMFLVEGSSQRSCNLASECTHVCWLVWVGVCAFLCVGWYVPPEVRVDCCALIVARCACACACMSARVNACSSTAGLDLTASSGHHRARARPNDAASLGALLPPELEEGASRVRPCHGFAALEAKSDDPSTQNRGVRAATAKAL